MTDGAITGAASLETRRVLLADRVIEPDAETCHPAGSHRSLQRLVEDPELVSRAEEGRLPLDLTSIDIGAVAQHAVESFAPTAQARAIVHVHGGELNAHSDGPGCGAPLPLRLPVAVISQEAEPEAPNATDEPGPADSNRRGTVGMS